MIKPKQEITPTARVDAIRRAILKAKSDLPYDHVYQPYLAEAIGSIENGLSGPPLQPPAAEIKGEGV